MSNHTVIVSITMAACTGWIFRAQATKEERAEIEAAAEAYNETYAGHATATTQRSASQTLALWRAALPETRIPSMRALEAILQDDGAAYESPAAGLAAWLRGPAIHDEPSLPPEA